MMTHTEPPLLSVLCEVETLVWYTDHSNGKDVREKLEVSFDKNNGVHSKLTVGLTERLVYNCFQQLAKCV